MEIQNKKEWLFLVNKFYNDKRLNVWHLALITAIILLAIEQNEYNLIHISRKKLMEKAHFQTVPTYHKYLKELINLKILKYLPSYHPGYQSTVQFLSE